jgi:hypothetical protein
MKHSKGTSLSKPRRLDIISGGRELGVGCARTRETNIRKKVTVADNFALMGDAIAWPILIKSGTLGALDDIINCTSPGVERFRGFYSVKDRRSPFSLFKQYCH